VGNEKYLADFWVIEAAGRAHGRPRCPAMASTSRIVHNRRTGNSLNAIREAVSDRGQRCS
jgi:hypothetical protein